MRELATIQRITRLDPIPGADRIELATVLGWHCVVSKGDFEEGDLCTFFEIDPVLPPIPEFEFMAKRNYRVRTIKLRGVISQGLAMPLAQLGLEGLKEGTDVTDILGVKKHCVVKRGPHIYNRTTANNPRWYTRLYQRILELLGVDPNPDAFPRWIPKTDERRIQSIPGILEKHAGLYVYVTEKLDGASVTCWVKDGKFGCASRNTKIDPKRKYSDLRKHIYPTLASYGLPESLGRFYTNLAIQGELIGPDIQGNRYDSPTHQFAIFNVYNIDEGVYLGLDRLVVLSDALGVPMVPILNGGTELTGTVDDWVKLASGKSALNRKVFREGIVVRAAQEMHDPNYGRLSFKVISNEYLLKYEANDDGDEL